MLADVPARPLPSSRPSPGTSVGRSCCSYGGRRRQTPGAAAGRPPQPSRGRSEAGARRPGPAAVRPPPWSRERPAAGSKRGPLGAAREQRRPQDPSGGGGPAPPAGPAPETAAWTRATPQGTRPGPHRCLLQCPRAPPRAAAGSRGQRPAGEHRRRRRQVGSRKRAHGGHPAPVASWRMARHLGRIDPTPRARPRTRPEHVPPERGGPGSADAQSRILCNSGALTRSSCLKKMTS